MLYGQTLADEQILGDLMNCACIDLPGKCLYDTGIIYGGGGGETTPVVGGEGGGGECAGRWGEG